MVANKFQTYIVQTKINVLLLNRITQILTGNNSAWTSIFSYFLGYTTRDILPELALNYVQHTIQTIATHNTIKTLYLKYKENIILDNCKGYIFTIIGT
jgi:hypothetical protein